MDDHDERRAAAFERLQNRRSFVGHVAVYVVVNTMLVVVWAASGAGYFWPIWPIVGWGVGLALNAWSIYGRKPITEEDIRKEAERDLP